LAGKTCQRGASPQVDNANIQKMQNFETYFKAIINDLKVELTDEFDRNFERKAFFDKPWPQTKWPVSKGSLMLRSGAGRKSIASKIEGTNIVWRSSLPYMALHNEGGEITVTAQMKRFFWAMYYKASGAISKTKGGAVSASQRNTRLTNEAGNWKALALMKEGHKMKIPKRQFIGNHPQVDASVKRVIDENMQQLAKELGQHLKNDLT
jgi:phage gpG-like protein